MDTNIAAREHRIGAMLFDGWVVLFGTLKSCIKCNNVI